MANKLVLVCDDDADVARIWSRQLNRASVVPDTYKIKPFRPEDLKKEIHKLEDRRRQSRQENGSDSPSEPLEIDKADVLVIDYDLLDLKVEGAVSGEEVAYLARCYSDCGFIIALNQFGENDFDLSLKGHPESFADLNIGAAHLSNPGLWKGEWGQFRPWMWPLIPDEVRLFKNRTEQLIGNLNQPILRFLGFPRSIVEMLPRSVLEHLGISDRPPEKITFRNFVETSPRGLRRKDQVRTKEAIARIAAARIHKWLERDVLPRQDILVDAPHLVSRYPSLLTGDVLDEKSWHQTACLASVSRLGISYRLLTGSKFSRSEWLSRAAWFWPELSNSERIPEVREPWRVGQGDHPDLVFCEDISRFLDRKETIEFVADLESAFVRRFVVKPDSRYNKTFHLEKVNYTPSVRFTL